MVATPDIRQLIAAHGPVRPQLPAGWPGPFPLPDALAKYFADIGPLDVEIKTHGNPFFLPSLGRLWSHQGGYRWHAVTQQPVADWPDDWLVVADQGADPFIFSRRSEAVSFARHGIGGWVAEAMFNTVDEMAACLGTLGGIAIKAGQSFTDESFCVAAPYRELAARSIGEILGDGKRASTILETLEWT